MSLPDDQILVSTSEAAAFAQVRGRGSFKVSGSLKEFGEKIFTAGQSELVLDLMHCVGMDSTFMGVIAGLSFRCKKEGRGKVILVNLNSKSLKLISTLGLNHLVEFYMVDNLPGAYAPFLASGEAPSEVASDSLSKEERARMMLQSHEDLAGLSEENRARFKDVLAYLHEEVDGTS
jgi:anti-anti-sigma regulatory factor